MHRSPRHVPEYGRRSQPGGRRLFAGLLLAAVAAALWLVWARLAAGINWAGLSDAGVLAAAAATALLLLVLPLLPLLVWAAGRQGTARRVALLAGLITYAALVLLDVGLLRT